ncbi:hypothetical protein ACFX13_013606 [Malus domestica]
MDCPTCCVCVVGSLWIWNPSEQKNWKADFPEKSPENRVSQPRSKLLWRLWRVEREEGGGGELGLELRELGLVLRPILEQRYTICPFLFSQILKFWMSGLVI